MGTMKVFITSIALTLITGLSYSQEKSAEERAAMQTEHMATNLGLSTEQKEKVAVLNLGVAQKNEAVRNNPVMTPEQKAEALKGNNEGRKNSLRTILTAEQFNLYEQQETSKKANFSDKKSMQNKKRKVQIQENPVKQ
jgi:Tfp pilus assembly protein PilV